MSDTLKQNYRFFRQSVLNHPAARALQFARRDTAAGITRYPATHGWNIGAPGDDGLQWVENPAAIGLRFAGFADEIYSGRRIDHKGWYTDSDGSNDMNYRGAVYQLPAREGCPVYVVGYRVGTYGRKGWSDDCGSDTGPARLALRQPIKGAPGGSTGRGSPDYQELAIRADECARVSAESAREYNEAWESGHRFAELGEEISGDRSRILELCREIKRARRDMTLRDIPAVCAALRDAVQSRLRDIYKARAEREKLKDSVYSAVTRSAFNEGADSKVFT